MTSCAVSVRIGARDYSARVEGAGSGSYFAESDRLGPLVDRLRRYLAARKRLEIRRLSLDMRQPGLSLAQRLKALGDCLPLFTEVECRQRK